MPWLCKNLFIMADKQSINLLLLNALRTSMSTSIYLILLNCHLQFRIKLYQLPPCFKPLISFQWWFINPSDADIKLLKYTVWNETISITTLCLNHWFHSNDDSLTMLVTPLKTTKSKNPFFKKFWNFEIKFPITIFRFSMKDTIKWVQTGQYLVQWFLR